MENHSYGIISDPSPVVKTNAGWIRGETRNGVAVFRGVPYGGKTDGNRRFRLPQPPQSWTGVLDCIAHGPACPQHGSNPGTVCGTDFMGPYFSGGDEAFQKACHDEPADENCLILNLQTPGLDGKKRPVMFYIHGGGYACGASSVMMANEKLEAEEDVVVVGVNHRLSAFGYLYLGALDSSYADSGMAGMMDVVLALEWVRDNIAAFGGDPDNVTIMGESGGGGKVSMLLAMPEAHGLFHKAVVESGSFPIGIVTKERAAENTLLLLKELNIGTNELEKLFGVEPEAMLDAIERTGRSFDPVGDDIHLPANPEKLHYVPQISKDIPLICGYSREEFGLFLPRDLEEMTWDGLRAKLIDWNDTGFVRNQRICTEETVDSLIDLYRYAEDVEATPAQAFMRVQAMAVFGRDAAKQALTWAKGADAPVYAYLITFAGNWPEWRPCAWHTQDLALQFRVVRCPESEGMSRTIAHAYSQFARTGNPSSEELPWPAYTENERLTMVLDYQSCVKSDPQRRQREALPPV